jgi:hypothetical protein
MGSHQTVMQVRQTVHLQHDFYSEAKVNPSPAEPGGRRPTDRYRHPLKAGALIRKTNCLALCLPLMRCSLAALIT